MPHTHADERMHSDKHMHVRMDLHGDDRSGGAEQVHAQEAGVLERRHAERHAHKPKQREEHLQGVVGRG